MDTQTAPYPDTYTSPSSSLNGRTWKYEVFLSFRGVDTRKTFRAHLYHALVQSGVTVYTDDSLQRGDSISLGLCKAIEESRISIVILSSRYANSTWCLNELAKIVECMKVMGQRVFPVFYDVEPSEVRKQTGAFGDAFAHYEQRFRDNREKVLRWRDALYQVANLSGFEIRDRYESEVISRIVKRVKVVLNELSHGILRASFNFSPRTTQMSGPALTKLVSKSKPMSSRSSSLAAGSSVALDLPWKYDVFLSFRGETRFNFTAYLHERLREQGITKTCLDEEELEKGRPVSELFTAIEQSRLAIVVISPKYASSKWCMNELLKILECMEKRGALLPIFYSVEPSDVGKQSGNFGEAFTELEQRFKDEKEMVERWRAALRIVAKIKGWTSKDRLVGITSFFDE